MGFSQPFRERGFLFFTGSITEEDTMPHTVTLNGVVYPIDLAMYRYGSLSTLRETVVANATPDDSLFNAAGSWSRYRYSWHRGADQEFADLDANADPFRYDWSYGVNVWDKNELTLQRDLDIAISTAGTNNPVLLTSANYLFCGDGADLHRYDGGSWTTLTVPGGTVQALSTDGTDVYVATSTVLVRYIGTGTTPTAFSTPVTGNISNVAFVANRLLIGVDNVLQEVSSTGAVAIIRTHQQSSFRWTTIFAVGSRIYAGGFAGSRSELYSLTVDSTGALVQSAEAAPFPAGELIYTAHSFAGNVAFGTSDGIRFATIGGDGTLTYGPLFDKLGVVKSITSQGRYVYATGFSQKSGYGTTFKFDLSEFVAPLQPAYAEDIGIGSSSTLTSVARYGDITYFAVPNNNVYKEGDGFLEEAYLDSGYLYFGTVEPKRLSSIDVLFDPLNAGHFVELEIYDELGNLLASGIQQTVGTTSLEVDLDANEAITVRIVLKFGAPAVIPLSGPPLAPTTPRIRRWRVRAYPVAPTNEQWIVPIIAHSRVLVGDGMGAELAQDPGALVDDLVDLWERKTKVVLQIGDRVARVRIDGFELQPAKWTDDGEWFEATVILKLIST